MFLIIVIVCFLGLKVKLVSSKREISNTQFWSGERYIRSWQIAESARSILNGPISRPKFLSMFILILGKFCGIPLSHGQ